MRRTNRRRIGAVSREARMRRPLLGMVLVLGAFAGSARGGDPPKEVLDRVTKSLTDADPLAEGTASDLLDPDPPTRLAIWAVAFRDGVSEVARERALRLTIADNRANRVEENAPAKDHHLVWWLALDEIDREIPRGPREALLAQALPDTAQQDASLKALAAGREVAARFCSEWDEVEFDAEQAKKHAALRAELEKAGYSAIPYLATVLAVPPQATFTVTDEKDGITGRQQARALWALDFLKARLCTSFVVFHVRGPSRTGSTTALGVLHRLAGIEYPKAADEAAQVAAIETWWHKGWNASWEQDHFVRHVIRWAREALASGDPERERSAQFGPLQLEALVGKLEYDAKAPLATRTSQLAAIEREAIGHCPSCIR